MGICAGATSLYVELHCTGLIPQFPQKLPFKFQPSTSSIWTAYLIHGSLDSPNSPPKRYPDRIVRFSTIHDAHYQRTVKATTELDL